MTSNKVLILISIIFIFILNLAKSMYVFNYKYDTSSTYTKMNCMVIQKESVKEDKVSYLVEYNSNKFILNIFVSSYLEGSDKTDLTKFSNYTYGDVLEFRGKITIPEKLNNPFEFDYKRYLNSNNIVATITTYEVKNVDKVSGNILLKFGYAIREALNEVVDKKMGEKEAGLFKSMMYGNNCDLKDEISMSFSENGISHMLAVSGLHFVYIIKILNFVTKDMDKNVSLILNFFIIFLFSIISSMSISVIRASIMAGITILNSNKKESNISSNNKWYRDFHIYKKFFIAFVIIIVYNPYCIYNLSFQMSFLATLGIITYNNLVYSYFMVVLKIRKKYKYIVELLSLSISANILILPLQIYYFGKFELVSFLSNILLSQVISFQFLLGFISIFLAFIPFISDIVITSNIVVLKCIILFTNLLQKINYFTIYIPRLNYLEIFLIYLTIFFNTNKKFVTVIFKKKHKKIARIVIYAVTIFTFLYSISMYVYRVYLEEYIYFFNVAQGNMAIVRSNRKVVVIDIGSTSKSVSANVLRGFLNAKAIHSIDAICITHMHEDHVNGIYEILDNFNVKSVIYSTPQTTQKGEFEKLFSILNDKNISKIEVLKNDKIVIGDIFIEVLMPLNDKVIISDDMLNSNSSVYFIENNSKNILFMGDATLETEKLFLNTMSEEIKEKIKRLDAIQIGHHGSKTSSCEEFIKSINPCLAIISSKKEKYGHPHKITLDTLEKYKFNVKITEECGAIKID